MAKYQIFTKQKQSFKPFSLEKFLTGGKKYKFKEAQKTKKSLQNMASSFLYKVVKVK